MRLALGTVQFGLNYGIANNHGQVALPEMAAILDYAYSCGVRTLDTAAAYGESETRLGQMRVQAWQVVSKLPEMPDVGNDISSWVGEATHASLGRLRVNRLYGLLLHRPEQLLKPSGSELYSAMTQLKRYGLVEKIGVSIYDPQVLDRLAERRYTVDLVQAPLNVFDCRLVESGWLSRLVASGVEVHARSVFLQGLLLLRSADRPQKFGRWSSLWNKYDEWLADTDLAAWQACLGHVLSFRDVGKVVVGVDSVRQLAELIQGLTMPALRAPTDLCCNDPQLVNPSAWVSL